MVRFIDDPITSEAVKPKISAVKWKMMCGIGMTGLHFITIADNKNDLFDIYPAAVFKQRSMRRSDRVIIGIADSHDAAASLIASMIQKCIDERGNLTDVRGYYEEFVRDHM